MAIQTASTSRFKTIVSFIKELFTNFSDDKVMKYSASLSYYTIFAIAPILTIIISIFARVFGREAVQNQVFGQINGLVGNEAAKQIQDMLSNTAKSGNTFIASVISIIVLIFSATAIFGEIQDSINSIWGLKSKPKSGLIKLLINRLISFSLIISLGFIAMVSLILDAAVTVVSDLLAQIPGIGSYFVLIINYALNFVVITFMFSVIFKVLPDAKIKWRDVVKGSVLTAILFIVGKELIKLYVDKSNLTSVYGAAGSIVVLLVWVYYTAIILYFGAEFTKVYSIRYGSKILPNDYAVFIKVKEEEQPQEKALHEVKQEEEPHRNGNK